MERQYQEAFEIGAAIEDEKPTHNRKKIHSNESAESMKLPTILKSEESRNTLKTSTQARKIKQKNYYQQASDKKKHVESHTNVRINEGNWISELEKKNHSLINEKPARNR